MFRGFVLSTRLRTVAGMWAGWLGLFAGLVHVLSGPDHLAAVAPLAVRGHARAWATGLRWGLGHSAGVVLVGLLFLGFREALPLERLSAVSERLVGVLLLGIGVWSIRQAMRLQVHAHSHEHGGSRHDHVHLHSHVQAHEAPGGSPHHHGHAAFGIGTLHGLAGSSHFVGVMAAAMFATRADRVSYLLTFAVGTVLGMVAFSAALGAVAARWRASTGRVFQALLMACGGVAFGVGGWWLWNG
jgi:hypothetical protein